ncbi:MAG: AAA family ATPase [Chitinophagaceae bacterium]|nr:MAG: AAA family ATPase [Chitinophagaceae bacterium]
MADSRKKQVLIRGAAGSGKTSLLAYVARELKRRDLRVLIAANPTMLPSLETLLNQAWEGQQEGNPEKQSQRPLYLLIDEAQQSYAKGILHALLKIHPNKRNIVIIAAGIPGKTGESAAFSNRIEPERVLLSEDEVCQDPVVQFFYEKLALTLGDEHVESTARAATIEVLKFSHYYTAGHAYACLKIAEYCVTQQASKCISEQLREKLGLALGSKAFLEAVGNTIFHRCFPFFSNHAAVDVLRNDYVKGGNTLVRQLQEHGLWDSINNRLLSPLLQYHLFCLMPKADDFVFTNSSQIGDALYHCTRDYKRWKFTQYEAGTDAVRDRCEDGISFFLGCELSKYCLVSPQHAISRSQATPGRPPSVDYYLNGRLDMYLEVVKNGSLLEEHFDRFITGDYGVKKPFAVLDINFKTEKPRDLKGKYAEYNKNFFTYVVHTRQLFRGMELFKYKGETSVSAPSKPVGTAS